MLSRDKGLLDSSARTHVQKWASGKSDEVERICSPCRTKVGNEQYQIYQTLSDGGEAINLTYNPEFRYAGIRFLLWRVE